MARGDSATHGERVGARASRLDDRFHESCHSGIRLQLVEERRTQDARSGHLARKPGKRSQERFRRLAGGGMSQTVFQGQPSL
jgi:hypothetical protein